MFKDSGPNLHDSPSKPVQFVDLSSFCAAGVEESLAGFGVEVLPESGNFVVIVKGFYGLLERDGDKQAGDNCCNMNEETFPGMRDFMRCVDVEHRS
jgi:hypothetical protein